MKKVDIQHPWFLTTPPEGSALWTSFSGYLESDGGTRLMFDATYICPHVVTNGSGHVEFDGQHFELKRGDMFMLWPGKPIAYWDTPDDPWSFHYFRLDGEKNKEFTRRCGLSPETPVITPENPDEVIRIFESIYELCGTCFPGDEYEVLSTLYQLPKYCRKHVRTLTNPPTLAEQACHLIDSLLSTGINVNDLCEILRVSRPTLFRAFKKEMRASPIAYLKQRRIDEARRLLSLSDAPLEKIAVLSGFKSKKYFIKVFKEQERLLRR